MKKRYYISLAITIVLLIIAHKFWIINNNSKLIFYGYPFLIIIICGYLIVLKITSYLADFKNIKQHSRIEIIFLTLFFIMLFIPMSNINKDKISEKENRTLATWKPFIINNQINYNFGKDFDDWFNDRFATKYILTDLNNLSLFLNRSWQTNKVIKGRDGWLFFKRCGSIRNFQNLDLFSKEELEEITQYIESIDNYCKKRNKKFYFVITPDKNKIYGEFYPYSIKKTNPDSKSRAFQLIKYLEENTSIKVIYPYEALHKEKSKNKPLYFKTDTHWNELGAYVAYKEIMKVINSDNKLKMATIGSISYSKYSGDLNEMLTKRLKQKKEIIPSIQVKNKSHTCLKTKDKHDVQECQNIYGKQSLLMYRDSFTISLIPLLAETFKHSKYIWDYSANPQDIDNYDVIILETVERHLPKLKNKSPLEE